MVLVWVGIVTAVVAVAIFAWRAYYLRASIPKEFLENTELLRGKVVLMTGATAGIGLATAQALHKMGARIILGARDPARAQKAISQIKQFRPKSASNPPQVEVLSLDLLDLDSVRQFADEFRRMNLPVDYLILNAGAVFYTPDVSKDGFEKTFQTNHLSNFLLTTSLLDIINKSRTKIVVLSSNAHEFVRQYKALKYEDVKSDMSNTHAKSLMGTYSLSKLCNILFVKELQRRVANDVIVAAVHPGFVHTEIGREAGNIIGLVLELIYTLFAKTAMQGAYTTLHVILNKDIKKGGYYVDCAEANTTETAANPEYARQLWELSEQCIKK